VTYPSKISSIMLSISLPIYSRAPDADEMRRLRLRVMATHAAAMFPVLVSISVTAPVLVPWLLGAAWESSVVPTQLLAGAGMVAAVVTGSPTFITALGKPQYVPPIIVVMLVGLGLTAYFSAPLGLNGVAACVLGYYVFFLFVNHYFLLHRGGGIGLRDLFADAIPPLLACMPLAAAELVTRHGLVAAGAAPLIVVTATVVVGFAAYAAALRLLFPETWKILLRVARRIVGRPHSPGAREVGPGEGHPQADSPNVSTEPTG
jgi:lipopolysaccharide exporter